MTFFTAAFLITSALSPDVVEVFPTQDVWVYPHASDNKDPFLRVWGADGVAIAESADAAQNLSYSYLRFDLPAKPWAGKRVTGATLILWHIADPAWDEDSVKSAPIEVRALNKGFDEKTWDYGLLSKVFPDKARLYGATSPNKKLATAKPFSVEINLLGNDSAFAKDLSAASDGTLNLALTSKLDPSEGKAVYKFYSKDADKELRPVLRLTLE